MSMTAEEMKQRALENACLNDVISWCDKYARHNRHILRYLKAVSMSGWPYKIKSPDFIKYGTDRNGKPVLIGIEHFAAATESKRNENGKICFVNDCHDDMAVLRELYLPEAKSMDAHSFCEKVIDDGLFVDLIKDIVLECASCNYITFIRSLQYSINEHLRTSGGKDKVEIYRGNVCRVGENYKRSGIDVLGFLIDASFVTHGLTFLIGQKKIAEHEFFVTDLFVAEMKCLQQKNVDFVIVRWKSDYRVRHNHDGQKVLLLDLHGDIIEQCEKQGMPVFNYAYFVLPEHLKWGFPDIDIKMGVADAHNLGVYFRSQGNVIETDRTLEYEWYCIHNTYVAMLRGYPCATSPCTYELCKEMIRNIRSHGIYGLADVANIGLSSLKHWNDERVAKFKQESTMI